MQVISVIAMRKKHVTYYLEKTSSSMKKTCVFRQSSFFGMELAELFAAHPRWVSTPDTCFANHA